MTNLVCILSKYLVGQLMAYMFCNTNHVPNSFFGIGGEATAVKLVIYFLVEVELVRGTIVSCGAFESSVRDAINSAIE